MSKRLENVVVNAQRLLSGKTLEGTYCGGNFRLRIVDGELNVDNKPCAYFGFTLMALMSAKLAVHIEGPKFKKGQFVVVKANSLREAFIGEIVEQRTRPSNSTKYVYDVAIDNINTVSVCEKILEKYVLENRRSEVENNV